MRLLISTSLVLLNLYHLLPQSRFAIMNLSFRKRYVSRLVLISRRASLQATDAYFSPPERHHICLKDSIFEIKP